MLMMMNSVFIERTERNSLEGVLVSIVGILMLFQAAQGDDNPEMCEILLVRTRQVSQEDACHHVWYITSRHATCDAPAHTPAPTEPAPPNAGSFCAGFILAWDGISIVCSRKPAWSSNCAAFPCSLSWSVVRCCRSCTYRFNHQCTWGSKSLVS